MTALPTRLQSLFDKTKPVCFGRFVFDVPTTAEVVYGPAWAPSDITRLPREGDEIDAHVADRLRIIEDERDLVSFSQKAILLAKDSMYGKSIKGATPGQQLVVGQSRGIFWQIESFKRVGADLYIQKRTASPERDELAVQSMDTLEDAMRELNEVARNLRPREDGEAPTEPGLCIDGAFISDNPSITHERVTLGVRLKEFPDVHFSIEVNKNQGRVIESSALEASLAAGQKDAESRGGGAWYSRIKTLRRGPRKQGDWSGFEALMHLPAQASRGELHEFSFVSLGDPTSPLIPMLDVELKTGVKDNRSGALSPSLTDEEAVALWDRLSGSIRVRPTTATVKTTDAAPAKFPLGELAATGRDCPQSGWWQCADEGAVLGERRQYFRLGDRMPRVALQGRPSVWQKLKGDAPTYSIATVWTLVGYEAGQAKDSPPTPPDPSSFGPQP